MYGPVLLGALLLPYGVLLAVGFAYPLISAIQGSFGGEDGTGQAYSDIFGDPLFWTVLGRTFRTAALVALICVVIAYPTAELIHRAPGRLRPLLLALVVIPLWSSVIARTYGWVGVFQNNGVLDRIADLFGAGPLRLLYTPTAVVVGMVHVMLPLVLLPTYAAVRGYDERLSLASLSLGAGKVRTLLRVKLPVLAPQLAAAATGVFILSLGFFVTPAVLGGPRSQLVSSLISQQVFQTFNLSRAHAMSMVLLVAALAMLALLGAGVRLLRRYT
jgi:putative spermidine/putrescine transport system permease protein